MKLLTININDRIDYTINFDGTDGVTETFILEKSNPLSLFKLYKCENKKQSSVPVIIQTEKHQAYAYIKSVDVQEVKNADDMENEDVQDNESSVFDEATNDIMSPEVSTSEARTDSDEVSYRITITLSETECNVTDNLSGDDFRFIEENCQFESLSHHTGIVHINVSFVYETPNGGALRNEAFSLHMGEKNEIADVVLDFGSESSQMAIFKRGQDHTKNDIMNIFSLMKDAYWKSNHNGGMTPPDEAGTGPTENDVDADFRQYETQQLYRSVFFVKKTISGNEFENLRDGYSCDDPDVKDTLSVMCRRDGMETRANGGYVLMPNSKIADYGIEVPRIMVDNVDTPITSDGVLPDACLYPFLYIALKRIHEDNRNRVVHRRLVALRMLMPNVYSHRRTVEKLHTVARFVNQIISKEINGCTISAVEISAVSESDASLIGRIYSNASHTQFSTGHYLVLDAGKGTLDFSLVHYDAMKSSYANLYRSGIIGAGNAISYGYFLGFLQKFIDTVVDNDGQSVEVLMQRFIRHAVLGEKETDEDHHEVSWLGNADPADLYRMCAAVDGYKKGSRPTRRASSSVNNTKKINEISLGTFARWIEKQDVLEDEYLSSLNTIVNKLVEDVKKQIEIISQMEVHGFVFTGRGFRCEAFRKKMESMLKGVFGNSETVNAFDYSNSNNNYPKIICLFIAAALANGGFNHHVISTPYCFSADQNNNDGHSAITKAAGSYKKKLIERLKSIDIFLPGNVGSDQSNNTTHEGKSRGKDMNNPSVYGFKVEKRRLSDLLNVAGTTYSPSRQPPHLREKDGLSIDIFFEGKHIWTRCNNKCAELDCNDEVKLDVENVFESLFPYCVVSQDFSIPIYYDVQNSIPQDDDNQQPASSVD